MKTLKENYKRNIDILKENLKRGITQDQIDKIINAQENAFTSAGLYNEEEKDYINEMRAVVIEYFTHLKINIIK
jgi:5'-3' exonuclease